MSSLPSTPSEPSPILSSLTGSTPLTDPLNSPNQPLAIPSSPVADVAETRSSLVSVDLTPSRRGRGQAFCVALPTASLGPLISAARTEATPRAAITAVAAATFISSAAPGAAKAKQEAGLGKLREEISSVLARTDAQMSEMQSLARKVALNYPLGGPIKKAQLVDAIINYFRSHVKDAEYFIKEAASNISSLHKQLATRYNNYFLGYSGFDSTTRRLLTEIQEKDKDNEVLSRTTIMGLLAIEALLNPSPSETKEEKVKREEISRKYSQVFRENVLNPRFQSQATGQFSEITLSRVFKTALSEHSTTMMALTNNLKAEPKDNYRSYLFRRQNVPQIESFVASTLADICRRMKISPEALPQDVTHFNQPYDASRWQDYQVLFEDLCKKMGAMDAKAKEALVSSSNKRMRQGEVQYAYDKCAVAWGMRDSPANMTMESFAKEMAESTGWLQERIAHLAADRLHFGTSLLYPPEIRFQNGTFSVQDILRHVVAQIAKEGVNERNAVAAEQLYVRIMLLADWYQRTTGVSPFLEE